jgi:hypothetical protein
MGYNSLDVLIAFQCMNTTYNNFRFLQLHFGDLNEIWLRLKGIHHVECQVSVTHWQTFFAEKFQMPRLYYLRLGSISRLKWMSLQSYLALNKS